MLLPLLTRNLCICLLNVFFSIPFFYHSIQDKHYEISLEIESILRNWALFDERPKKKNKIYNGPRWQRSIPNILNFLSHGSNFKGEIQCGQFMICILILCSTQWSEFDCHFYFHFLCTKKNHFQCLHFPLIFYWATFIILLWFLMYIWTWKRLVTMKSLQSPPKKGVPNIVGEYPLQSHRQKNNMIINSRIYGVTNKYSLSTFHLNIIVFYSICWTLF